jgi:acetyl esterase/lipase
VKTKSKAMKAALGSFAAAVIIAAASYDVLRISPWPSALYVRKAMDQGGIETAQALEKYVPAGIVAWRNEQYSEGDPDAYLDVFSPSQADKALPAIVWVHGGGWLAGSKDHIANYLMVLAARGYTVVGVNYALSPEKTYPTPVLQLNAALGYIAKNAARLHVDPSRFFLAGDSSGAQIAAQMAAIISGLSYAKAMNIVPSIDRAQLRGVILYCGLYDGVALRGAKLSLTLKTQLWAYFGTRDSLNDPRLEEFSVAQHLTSRFPPMFISVGNADWLTPQSIRFAEAASSLGVAVDSLFFAADHTPPVGHEFQFNLDTDESRLALERSVKFLEGRKFSEDRKFLEDRLR